MSRSGLIQTRMKWGQMMREGIIPRINRLGEGIIRMRMKGRGLSEILRLMVPWDTLNPED